MEPRAFSSRSRTSTSKMSCLSVRLRDSQQPSLSSPEGRISCGETYVAGLLSNRLELVVGDDRVLGECGPGKVVRLEAEALQLNRTRDRSGRDLSSGRGVSRSSNLPEGAESWSSRSECRHVDDSCKLNSIRGYKTSHDVPGEMSQAPLTEGGNDRFFPSDAEANLAGEIKVMMWHLPP